MNAQELFLLRYRSDHPGMSRRMLADLSEAQVRNPPCPGVNTLTWLVWHIARAEDIGVSRFVTDGEQVLDAGHWGTRLGVKRRDFGTGMTPEEVLDLSAQIDVEGLHAYWDAVEERTVAVVQRLHPDDLDTSTMRRMCAESSPTTSWTRRTRCGCVTTWKVNPAAFSSSTSGSLTSSCTAGRRRPSAVCTAIQGVKRGP